MIVHSMVDFIPPILSDKFHIVRFICVFSGARCSSRPPDFLGVLYPIGSTHFDDSSFIIWQPDPAGNLPNLVWENNTQVSLPADANLGYERVNVAGNRMKFGWLQNGFKLTWAWKSSTRFPTSFYRIRIAKLLAAPFKDSLNGRESKVIKPYKAQVIHPYTSYMLHVSTFTNILPPIFTSRIDHVGRHIHWAWSLRS